MIFKKKWKINRQKLQIDHAINGKWNAAIPHNLPNTFVTLNICTLYYK